MSKQKLIIIAGSPCVGKTTVTEKLFTSYENSAFFDGDWAWCVNPFSVDDPRLRNDDKTMSFALSTYLNSSFDYVFFSSVVVVDKTIREAILKDVTAKDYSVVGITLTCSEETLRERHKKRGDENECSFFWLHLEPYEGDYVINTDNKSVQQIVDEMKVITLVISAMIAALAIEEFLVPCTILDGGIVGISIMINNLSKIPLGVLTLVLNLPFLIAGMRKLGIKFIIKSAAAMVAFSSSLEIFAPLTDMTRDYLLAVCFGGVFLGIGVGLVIRSGGCLDGTETVAIFLNRRFNLPVGQTVLFINIMIYTTAGFLFGFDRAMYSLLTYFITSKVIDFVEAGVEQAKAAMIITNEGRKIADEIYKKMGRTVTILEGEGLISGKKAVLYCVLNRLEVYQLKQLIKEVDAQAFITVSDVSEIIGNHIKKKADKD